MSAKCSITGEKPMELDITRFFMDEDAADYSASAAELGQNAGKITWNAAKEAATTYDFLDTDEKRDAFRAYVKGFGAWSEEEIAAWDNDGLNALLIQMISGDMREGGLNAGDNLTDAEWEEYENGGNAGRLYRGDSGKVYYYIGD
jgi:hypothetical protein